MSDREEFEKWAIRGNMPVDKYDSGAYKSWRTLHAWAAWQARQPEIDALDIANEKLGLITEKLREENAALKAEVERLRKDAKMLDWLSDPENKIGHVLLPKHCVHNNLHSLRDAIDAAMKETK